MRKSFRLCIRKEQRLLVWHAGLGCLAAYARRGPKIQGKTHCRPVRDSRPHRVHAAPVCGAFCRKSGQTSADNVQCCDSAPCARWPNGLQLHSLPLTPVLRQFSRCARLWLPPRSARCFSVGLLVQRAILPAAAACIAGPCVLRHAAARSGLRILRRLLVARPESWPGASSSSSVPRSESVACS